MEAINIEEGTGRESRGINPLAQVRGLNEKNRPLDCARGDMGQVGVTK